MKRLFFISVVLTGILFSCQEKAPNNDDQLKAGDPGANSKVRCLEMVFPLTFIMPDGSTITGNDRKEIRFAMKRWYEANPGSKERPTLQYPVDVIFKGRPMPINNVDEMKRVKVACKKDRKSCFDFIYPITYIMPDGSTITGNDGKEIKLALRRWYEANPGSKELPTLQYPVEIKFRDGTILTIHNKEEMRRAKVGCE